MTAFTPYRTILAVHPAHDPPERLERTAAFARAFGAHLDVRVLETMPAVPTTVISPPPAYWWDETFTAAIERTARRGEEVRDWLVERHVPASVQADTLQAGLVGDRVAGSALHCDLVVIRTADSLVSGLMGHALEGALFGAGKPVLVLEAAADEAPITPPEALIAWDGSREAARAVQQALPLLRGAGQVRAVVVEDAQADELERDAQALARHLARHDVSVGIERVAPAGRLVAHALADHVKERRPDLLVMGAYGHARLRERLFSGATRTALTELDVPLLLAR